MADPSYNTAVFSSSASLAARSVFTDKGPIGRPPLTLVSGTSATITSPTTVTVTVGSLTTALVGKYLRLTGTGHSDGDYFVLSVPAPNKLVVRASFSIPDTAATAWSVFDPRDGQIADDPSHVTVRVNGTAVMPEAVVGLLGQIVLPAAPLPTDNVEVDYSWVPNPTVDVTRLNSREFRFNNWNRDLGRPNDVSGHKYRYNNVLLEPSTYRPSTVLQQGTGVSVTVPDLAALTGAGLIPSFVGLTLSLINTIGTTTYHRITEVVSSTVARVDPILVGPYVGWSVVDQESVAPAVLDQPEHRELHYRAYERAYTPVFNDPNLLILNSPTHKIAYPPLERSVSAKFVSYDPTVLPESYPTDPWERVGVGLASIVSNELIANPTTDGPFPEGSPLFWRQRLDQSFPHAYALAWRLRIPSVTTYQGVWSGIGAGYSTELRAVVVGYLMVGGVRKLGILRKGFGNDPSNVGAWIGGFSSTGPTNAPVDVSWEISHTYRIFRSKDGVVRLYLDGEIVESLRVTEEDLPFLEELSGPFDELQQVYFGSLSREVRNQAAWGFVRYQVLPTNPYQVAPSIFVSYEGNQRPEEALPPWTPVGYHGTETIRASNYLLLESTSATDLSTEEAVGLVGGDFRGFVRPEPLLEASADTVLDVGLRGLTHTHGVSPNALMAAIDDGSLLAQVSFLCGKAAPKLSYGGRSLPTEWTPTPWGSVGAATVGMVGRALRITDASTTTGLIYYIDDGAPPGSPERVFESTISYMAEIRCRVLSYMTDAVGFAGVTADLYDGTRALGVLLREVSGVREVALHSDGIVHAAFPFEWFDGLPHTYRLVKSDGSVSLYVDADFIGVVPYTTFVVPSGGGSTGVWSFGSSTATSVTSTSTVDWEYANAWRVWPEADPDPLLNQQYYVGIWKGHDSDSLIGYHLPLKAAGRDASVTSNILTSPDPLPPGIEYGDRLIIDDGPNKGTYTISLVTPTSLVISETFPVFPTQESFRVPRTTNWANDYHRFRLNRTPAGSIAVLLDTDPTPLIQVGYNNVDLPPSSVGLPRVLAGDLPSISWGAFDPTNLSSSSWDYVRYGITRAPTELRIVPHHQVMNQRNVIASPEHLRTNIPHPHTDFWSSSTGIPPQTEPDVLRDPALIAFTRLNEGTPLVPRTQTSEVRVPTPVREFISAFNRIEDVLNVDGDFRLNDGSTRHRLLIPDDVLYNSLEVIEQVTGERNLLAPFDDHMDPNHYEVEWRNEVCLRYDGSTLPEDAPNQPTPWVLAADNPDRVITGALGGTLTFGTNSLGTRAIYRNATPLSDSPSLSTRVTFRVRVAQDGTLGLGDSQIRLGFSAPGMTLALAFVTLPDGHRYVAVVDLRAHTVLGGIPFNYLDGAYHTYQVVRDPGRNTVNVSVLS